MVGALILYPMNCLVKWLYNLSSFAGDCLFIQKELRRMGMVTSPFTWQSLRRVNFLLAGRLMPASNCLYLIGYGTCTWPFKVCSLIIDAWMYNSNWNWNLRSFFVCHFMFHQLWYFLYLNAFYFIKKMMLIFVIWNAYDLLNPTN